VEVLGGLEVNGQQVETEGGLWQKAAGQTAPKVFLQGWFGEPRAFEKCLVGRILPCPSHFLEIKWS
jgi:hypothetical protein